jgi:hypothetical protein
MSEDQPKQPELANSQPQRSQIPPVTEESDTKFQTSSESVKSMRNREQPFLKAQTIKILRGTIGLLEGVVESLETEPVAELPPTATPSATTPRFDAATSEPVLDVPTEASDVEFEEITEPTETPTATPEPIPASRTEQPVVSTPAPVVEEPVKPKGLKPAKPKLTDRVLPSFPRVQTLWDGVLGKIRLFLPESLNAKLSDWAITGAIAVLIVVILWTTAALLPQTPAQQAKAPPAEVEAPPELTAPKPEVPIKELPPPPPELTPEQNLIASIQTQVSEITEKYTGGLIQSIQANFQGSRLIVTVSDRWYELKPAQQNKLADETLSRSQELDFSKLEIVDPEGTLLARTPVVGNNMVILKREALAANL